MMDNKRSVLYHLHQCKMILTNDGRYYYEVPYDVYKEVLCELLKEQEPIIRCKDCRYAKLTHDGHVKYCLQWYEEGEPLYLDGDFFCGHAERM